MRRTNRRRGRHCGRGLILRSAIVAVVVAMLVGPAVAGEVYTPPKVKPVETLEPPADLRTDAIALLRAVQAGNVGAVEKFIAPKVTVVSGALDMSLPRRVEVLDLKPGRAVAPLGNHTGGDWDVPPDADIGQFLADMELDFIEGALTDGQPWGRDPKMPGTICTYGFHDFDPAEVKRAAGKLVIDPGAFVMVPEGTEVFDRPGGRTVATLSANLLYGVDYDADAPTDWMGLHLPQGGAGLVAVGEEGFEKPYAAGLCFAKSGGRWKIVGQASTGL